MPDIHALRQRYLIALSSVLVGEKYDKSTVIKMAIGVVTKPVEIFKVQKSSLKGAFVLEMKMTQVNKKQLLSLENPCYQQVLERYDHLKGLKMDDMDTEDFLPVHLILGACDYTKIN